MNKDNRLDAELLWETGWSFIRHVVDTAREPFLILDDNLKILSANEAFYKTFQLLISETEGKYIYDLGGGQWNIPVLCRLLEEILPRDKHFRDYEIEHEYKGIGKKIMLMNARQIFKIGQKETDPKLIILAMEDVTKQRQLEQQLKSYSQDLEARVLAQTKLLTERIEALEKK